VLTIADWLPPLMVGLFFTAFGTLKLIGLRRGVVGGHDQPFAKRLCGT
jgi:hypothetical protein